MGIATKMPAILDNAHHILKHNVFEAGYLSTVRYNGSYSGEFLPEMFTFFISAVYKGLSYESPAPSYESPATTNGIHRATFSVTTYKNSPHS